jgi:hypothetical protein
MGAALSGLLRFHSSDRLDRFLPALPARTFYSRRCAARHFFNRRHTARRMVRLRPLSFYSFRLQHAMVRIDFCFQLQLARAQLCQFVIGNHFSGSCLLDVSTSTLKTAWKVILKNYLLVTVDCSSSKRLLSAVIEFPTS